jgi:hypothetical protein
MNFDDFIFWQIPSKTYQYVWNTEVIYEDDESFSVVIDYDGDVVVANDAKSLEWFDQNKDEILSHVEAFFDGFNSPQF